MACYGHAVKGFRFDTDIYLRVLYSAEYARRHRERFARLAPRTYLCSDNILIALSARRIGATVVSENAQDFALIQKFVSFSFLVIPPPG